MDSYKLIGGGEYILFVGIVSSVLRTIGKSGGFQTRYTDFKKQFNDTPELDIHNRHKTSFKSYKAKMIDDYQFNPGDEETGFDMRDVDKRTQMRTRYIEQLFYARIMSMFDAKIKVLFDSHQMQTEFREILFGNSNDIVLKQNQNCRSIYLKLQIHQYLKSMEGDIQTTDRYMLKNETEAYTDQFQSLKRDILQGGHLPRLISFYQTQITKLSEVLNSTYRDNNGEPLTPTQRRDLFLVKREAQGKLAMFEFIKEYLETTIVDETSVQRYNQNSSQLMMNLEDQQFNLQFIDGPDDRDIVSGGIGEFLESELDMNAIPISNAISNSNDGPSLNAIQSLIALQITNIEVSQQQTINQQNFLTTSSSSDIPSSNAIQTSNASPILTQNTPSQSENMQLTTSSSNTDFEEHQNQGTNDQNQLNTLQSQNTPSPSENMLIDNQIGTSNSLNNSTEVEGIMNTPKEGTSHNLKKRKYNESFQDRQNVLESRRLELEGEKKEKDNEIQMKRKARIAARAQMNQDLQKKRKKQKMTGNNFSKSPVKSGGLSIFCRKYCGQYKRTCVQDAIINAAKFYGYNIRRELKKKIPHVIGEDVDINKAMKEKCVKDILFFTPIPISNKKHGAEYYVFTKLLDSSGLYIITCTNTNYETNINENHAFVLDARFRDYKKN